MEDLILGLIVIRNFYEIDSNSSLLEKIYTGLITFLTAQVRSLGEKAKVGIFFVCHFIKTIRVKTKIGN